jgi:hypothetical protein
VAISSDGKLVATTSNDNTARVWDTATGREYVRLSYPDRPAAVAFASGPLLAVAVKRTVLLEPFRTEDLISDLCARMTRNLTPAEWKQYIGNEPYRPTCPVLPFFEPPAGVAHK